MTISKFKPFHPSQPGLVSAILKNLSGKSCDAALMNKIIEAANLVCEECARERVYAVKPMSTAEWLACDDVGQSSKYMLQFISDTKNLAPENGPVPRDADDLGRCIRMLEFTGLISDIDKIKEASSEWALIAENWTVLTQLYNNGDGEQIYAFLSNLCD